MASVTEIKIETVTPAGLVTRAREGRIRVPSFQRNYRWTARDVERLFDSILKRYPVGNVLLWERPAPAGRVGLGPLVLDVPAHSRAHWVVDGQQRITSLVGALAAPADVADPRFRVFVHLTERTFRATTRPLGAGWLPLRAAGSAQGLITWQREHWESLSEGEIAVADEVAAALREYLIPTYIVDAEDERELREVFDRVNTTGRPLDRAELFDALHGQLDTAEPGDLAAVADGVAAAGCGRPSEEEVLRCLLALRGPDVFRDVHGEFADDADRRAALALTERVLLEVTVLLRGVLSVPHLRLLPYPSLLPVLAAVVHSHGQPSGRAAVLLRRWFWRGTVLGNPAGSPPRVRRMLRAIGEADTARDAVGALLAELSPSSDGWAGPDLTRTAMNHALTRVNILALLDLAPRRLDTVHGPFPAPELDPAELLDETAHPLLPLLSRRDAGERFATVADRLLHPPLGAGDAGSAGGTVLSALLAADPATRASHAVDDRVAALLRDGAFPEALALRARAIEELVRDSVDARAEWGAHDGPTAAELMRPA